MSWLLVTKPKTGSAGKIPIWIIGLVLTLLVLFLHELSLGLGCRWQSPPEGGELSSTVPSQSISRSTEERYTVTQELMTALHRHMSAAKASNAAEFKEHCPSIMLQFLRDEAPHMVPLLDTLPVMVASTSASVSEDHFVGQELEDRILYERFWNEHTEQCHKFGKDAIFESGAYQGVKWSNTYFFEKHFKRPSILVEASRHNWDALDAAVKEHRPSATVHRAALCPVGDTTVCLDAAHVGTAMHGVQRTGSTKTTCQNSVPCFEFDESLHYGLISLDVEGIEWDFLKFRHPVADIIIIEVCQWLRQPHTLLTAVEMTARLAQLGYYLYAPEQRDEMVGRRNFVYVSSRLVDDCFAPYKIAKNQ